MDDNLNQVFQQAAVFQKMWTESFSEMAQVWTQYSPNDPPPDAMRQMRSGMLKVMTQSWDDFVRTPQFLEYMKQGMDGAMNFKKMSADFMSKAHHSTESPAREDIDGILLAIRHLERRLLDRIEEVDVNVEAVGRRLRDLEGQTPAAAPDPAPKKSAARKAAPRKAAPRKAAPRKTKPKS